MLLNHLFFSLKSIIMKIIKFIFLFVAISATAMAFTSCGNSSNKTEKQSKEYSSAFICPMHCDGSGSSEAGKCPVCGMDYVKNENHKTETKNKESQEEHDHNGHDHEGHDHEGHDHDDHSGHNH